MSRPGLLRNLFPVLAIVLASVPWRGLAQEAVFPKVEAIRAAIEEERVRQGIPGLSVALAVGEVAWTEGFGLADLENHVPAHGETVYRLASVSKPITALAVLQLAERGKLDLDAPVQQYVPDFPEKPWPITSRQLLAHMGGIRHYRGDEIQSTKAYRSVAEGLSIFQDDDLLHEPGSAYSYTTYGYNLLGAVIEGASGASYVEYVQANIFDPAGMTRTFVDEVATIIPGRAQGYVNGRDGELRNSSLADTSYKIPGGGWCSTAEDLVKFAQAVQSHQLVNAETCEEMYTKQKTNSGEEIGYGLGWRIADRDGRREVSHTGAQQRVATLLYIRPDEGVSVALMSNLERAQLNDLARTIADLATSEPRNK